MRVISHNGIIFEAKNMVSPALKRMASDMNSFYGSTTRNAQSFRSKMHGIFRGLNVDLSRETSDMHKRLEEQLGKEVFKQLNKDFNSFQRAAKDQMRSFQQTIMSGVALSMSGITIKRAGDSILGMINGWTDAAIDFEKTMADIRFLGKVSNGDFKQLKDTIIKLGIELPTSNLETAKAALVSLRAGYSAKQVMGKNGHGLARDVAMLSFFSNGALDTGASVKLLDSVQKQTGLSHDRILDYLVRTSTLGPLDIGEFEKAWRSQRSGYAMMGDKVNLPMFLSMMTMGRTGLTARFSGTLMSQFGASTLNMFRGGGKRNIKADLADSLGITTKELNGDPLSLLAIISERSKNKWGNDRERMAYLKTMLNMGGMQMLTAYETYGKNGMGAGNLYKQISGAKGFSEKYMTQLMGTMWGLREVVEGTKESFKQMMGEIYEPVLKPLLKGLQAIFGTLTNIVKDHPAVAKVFGYGLGLAGLLMSVGGVAAIVGGQFLSMYGSIQNTAFQLAFRTVKSIEDFAKLGESSKMLGSILNEKIFGPMKTFGINTLKMIGIMALFWAAWKVDLFGVRTATTNFFNNFQKSYEKTTAWMEQYRSGKIGAFALMERVKDYSRGDFWQALTAKLMKTRIFLDALAQAWGNWRKTGKFAISSSLMALLTGKDAGNLNSREGKSQGMLEAFTNLLNLILKLNAAWEGFKVGVKAAGDSLRWALKPIMWAMEGIGRIIMLITGTPGSKDAKTDRWRAVGTAFGTILSYIMAIKTATFIWRHTLGGAFGMIKKTGEFFNRHGVTRDSVKNIINDQSSGSVGFRLGKKSIAQGRRFGRWMFGLSNEMEEFTGGGRGAYAHGFLHGIPKGKLFTRKRRNAFSRWMAEQFGQAVYEDLGDGYYRKVNRTKMGKWGQRFSGRGGQSGSTMLGTLGLVAAVAAIAIPVIRTLGMRDGKFSFKNMSSNFKEWSEWFKTDGKQVINAFFKDFKDNIGPVMKELGSLMLNMFDSVGRALYEQFPWLKKLTGYETPDEAAQRIEKEDKQFVKDKISYFNTYSDDLQYLDPKRVAAMKKGKNWFQRMTIDSKVSGAKDRVIDSFQRRGKDPYEIAAFTRWASTKGFNISGTTLPIFEQLMRRLYGNGKGIDPSNRQTKKIFQNKERMDMIARNASINITNAHVNLGLGKKTKKHARGGFIGSRMFTELGEEGSEVVIPLSGHRNRAIDLWSRAGAMLGAGMEPAMAGSSGGTNIEYNFTEGSIVIQGGTGNTPTERRSQAKKLFSEIKKLAQEEQVRNHQRGRK